MCWLPGLGSCGVTHLVGSPLVFHGLAANITAGIDGIGVHNCLNVLCPIPDRLIVLPLPETGGAVPLFAFEPAT